MGLAGPVLGGKALFTYHRYNALFTAGVTRVMTLNGRVQVAMRCWKLPGNTEP